MSSNQLPSSATYSAPIIPPVKDVSAKHFDASIESIITRAKEIRKSTEDLLAKIDNEHATLKWPKALDNFALLSGQITSLMADLRSEKTPLLRNYPLVPLKLTQDSDPHLLSLTNGRLPALSHAEVPDYLRTKPDPSVEQALQQVLSTVPANEHSHNTQIQVQTFNKQRQKVFNMVQNARANSKVISEVPRTALPTTNHLATYLIFGIVQHGLGAKTF